MTDSAILRNNVRVKIVSSGLMNVGLGLVGAGAVRLFSSKTFDWTLAIWSLAAGVLIWLSLRSLSLLEAED